MIPDILLPNPPSPAYHDQFKKEFWRMLGLELGDTRKIFEKDAETPHMVPLADLINQSQYDFLPQASESLKSP